MRFQLTTASQYYTEKDKVRYESIGFHFNPPVPVDYTYHVYELAGPHPQIDLPDLASLLSLAEKFGRLILYINNDDIPELHIFDDEEIYKSTIASSLKI